MPNATSEQIEALQADLAEKQAVAFQDLKNKFALWLTLS
jgi:hypothetical protein